MTYTKKFISKGVYGGIFLFCSALFGINVGVTISTYLNRVTIDIIKEQPITESVHLPTVAICLKEPFRNVMKHMFSLEDYEGNTHDPTVAFIDNKFPNSWNVRYLNTFSFGKCILYEMDQKVKRVRMCTEFVTIYHPFLFDPTDTCG